MTRPALAIAIPTFRRAHLLDAILASLLPRCDALGLPVVVSDNASDDGTAEVCARHATRWRGLIVRRHGATIAAAENLMAAIAASPAEYTWLVGDDDFIVPRALEEVTALVSNRRPSAVVVGTLEIPRHLELDLSLPLPSQLAPLLSSRSAAHERTHTRATDLFRARFYDLPLPSVVYRTDTTLAADWRRYLDTHHAHIGALFDALALEEADKGRVDVVERQGVDAILLTRMGDQGKDGWQQIRPALFEELAHYGFPRWFELLPAIYQPYVPEGLAYHRHIFRAVLGEASGSS